MTDAATRIVYMMGSDDAFNCTGSSIFRFEDQVDGIQVMHRVGKSRAGRLLDGKEHNGDA